jgi:hypothetical protein
MEAQVREAHKEFIWFAFSYLNRIYPECGYTPPECMDIEAMEDDTLESTTAWLLDDEGTNPHLHNKAYELGLGRIYPS